MMTEIEIAYRSLAVYMAVHFKGEPKADDLRGLLRDARQFRAELDVAIEKAEQALREAEPEKP